MTIKKKIANAFSYLPQRLLELLYWLSGAALASKIFRTCPVEEKVSEMELDTLYREMREGSTNNKGIILCHAP